MFFAESGIVILNCYDDTVTQQEVIKHWREGAKQSFNAAKFMLENGSIGLCLFHCHLAIEKALKALYMEQCKATPPFTHGLDALSLQVEAAFSSSQRMFLHELSPQGVKGRYDEIDYHLNLPSSLEPAKVLKDTEEILALLFILP